MIRYQPETSALLDAGPQFGHCAITIKSGNTCVHRGVQRHVRRVLLLGSIVALPCGGLLWGCGVREDVGAGLLFNTRLPRSGVRGARYRVRTCDPYRVKVVLYH